MSTSISSRKPRSHSFTRLVSIKEKAVDNEHELYTAFIASLQREIAEERARALRFEQLYLNLVGGKTAPQNLNTVEDSEPLRSRMTRNAAMKIVQEYDKKQYKEMSQEDANQISEAIQTDAGRSVRQSEGVGRAI